MGFAKLMLSRMVTDNRVCGSLHFLCSVCCSPFDLKVLSSLILVYLSPDTADNQELRQCLSYFFPVYCYSSPANQRRMQQVFPSIFEQLATAYKALDDDQELVSPAQVGGMFVDWTDPQKAVSVLFDACHRFFRIMTLFECTDVEKSKVKRQIHRYILTWLRIL